MRRTHPQSDVLESELATESAPKDATYISPGSLSSGTPGRILTIASYFILGLGIGTMAAAAYMMLVSYTTVPYWDEWGVINAYIALNSHLPLQWIWAQNNEHRIVFQKLLLLLDLHLFKGREWPMFLAIFLSQFSLFGLLAFCYVKLGNWKVGPIELQSGLHSIVFSALRSGKTILGDSSCHSSL